MGRGGKKIEKKKGKGEVCNYSPSSQTGLGERGGEKGEKLAPLPLPLARGGVEREERQKKGEGRGFSSLIQEKKKGRGRNKRSKKGKKD